MRFLFLLLFLSISCFAKNDDFPVYKRSEIIEILKRNISENEFELENPYSYAKIGRLIKKDKKHAIICYIEQSQNYTLELFEIKGKKLIHKFKKDNLTGGGVFFDIKYDDWNFDGYKDITFRISASNGYVMEYFNLFLYQPKIESLYFKKDFSKLANPTKSSKNKSIVSESFSECAFRETCKSVFIWKKNNLIFVRKKCPC